jgi:hypothetical protein
MKLALLLMLALPACTIVPVDNIDSSDAGKNDAATSDAASSTVPAVLAGTSWTWVTGSGAQELSFGRDGSYTADIFLNGHPGDSCGTEYFTRRSGTATFAGDTLTLTPTASTRTKKDSCSDAVVSEDAIENTVSSYRWRLEDDAGGGKVLVLIDSEGSEFRYFPPGS